LDEVELRLGPEPYGHIGVLVHIVHFNNDRIGVSWGEELCGEKEAVLRTREEVCFKEMEAAGTSGWLSFRRREDGGKEGDNDQIIPSHFLEKLMATYKST
jgi:hypothetical protein